MDLVTGIERLTALVLLITGLSHVAAPRAWALFFIAMREHGEVAGLAGVGLGLVIGWISFGLPGL